MSSMKILFAPWREEYWNLSTKQDSKNLNKCVLCNPLEEELILISKYSYIISNKYPYASGHLLVCPKRHINNINDLTSKEKIDLFNLIDLSVYALKLSLKPEGYNIGCSVGKIAGESINHLHFHILPRFKGDVGWNKLCDFEVISVSPENLTKDLKKLILEKKLKKKFDIK
ncbi:MAG: HIT domain-containing protein [Candidatus ainarchaeum sp.]|nr:HIT domain-containing protein [Candidatus ainarchaeum sp.]MDD3975817.1 HIT domain-containing protein [Candidatus ainarchaeum sp.]